MENKYERRHWHFFLVMCILYSLSAVMFFSNFSIHVSGARVAPGFEVVDINGNLFKLSNISSKVILLDFFTTYCSPCRQAIEEFQDLYVSYTRDDLEIFSISPEDSATLLDFAQNPEVNMRWIVISDYDNSISDSYLGTDSRIPHLYLVDSEGYIRFDHIGWSGEPDATTLRQKIDALLSGEIPNGESPDGDDNPEQGLNLTIVIIAGAVIMFFLVGIFLAGQSLGWSKPSKKRRKQRVRASIQLGDKR